MEAELPALLQESGRASDAADAAQRTEALSHRPVDRCAPWWRRRCRRKLDAVTWRRVAAGAQIAVLEAMKMEHVLHAPGSGRVVDVRATPGEYLGEEQILLVMEPADADAAVAQEQAQADLDAIRPDLQRVIDRHAFTLDANRPQAVARRHAAGGRTARENVAHLCEGGSFTEYGALAVAAQTRRRSMDDLIANTPADGLVTGIGTVNAKEFGPEKSRCVVLAYDYTVLAGTQGMRNHHKKDRMLGLAHQLKLPVVLFAEGGGGRPGDVDMPIVAGLNNHTFSQFAALSGKVPVVGIVHGRCFAGNAALLGCADVIIATEASNIGMSGPAMIEGGGLGTFKPEQIGPSDVQSRNGVIDIVVKDEAEAVDAARRYLSYFQGPLAHWDCADQRALRHAVPENRLRVYDMRAAMKGLVDTGSLLELRAGFGAGMITALARIEGRAIGLIANNPKHLGGAIDVRGRGQGGPLHAAVQCPWPAHRLAHRHAGLHGRARDRSPGPGAPCLPHVRGGGPSARCRSSPWCCARATGWARRP